MLQFPGLKNYWYVACRSGALRDKPLKATLLGKPLVLFRGALNQPAALLDLCPHRNAPLSSGRIVGANIACPYHGWQFDGDGVCQLVPGLDCKHQHASRSTVRYEVHEQQGLVWVHGNPGEAPSSEPFFLPLLNTEGYRTVNVDFRLMAELPDALENFLDTTHTHLVHQGFIRDETKRRKIVVLVRSGADRTEAEYVTDGQESGIISPLFGGGDVDGSTDRFIMPSIVQLEHCAGERVKLMINLLFTPETETSLRVRAVVTGAGGFWRHLQVLTLGKFIFRFLIQQDHDILKLQLQNKQRHGRDARYVSTKLDLLRPHVMRLLEEAGAAPALEPELRERRVEVMI